MPPGSWDKHDRDLWVETQPDAAMGEANSESENDSEPEIKGAYAPTQEYGYAPGGCGIAAAPGGDGPATAPGGAAMLPDRQTSSQFSSPARGPAGGDAEPSEAGDVENELTDADITNIADVMMSQPSHMKRMLSQLKEDYGSEALLAIGRAAVRAHREGAARDGTGEPPSQEVEQIQTGRAAKVPRTSPEVPSDEEMLRAIAQSEAAAKNHEKLLKSQKMQEAQQLRQALAISQKEADAKGIESPQLQHPEARHSWEQSTQSVPIAVDEEIPAEQSTEHIGTLGQPTQERHPQRQQFDNICVMS